LDTDSARRFALQWGFVIHASSEGDAREALGRLEIHLGVPGTRATCGVIGLFDILENESIFPRLAVQDRDRG